MLTLVVMCIISRYQDKCINTPFWARTVLQVHIQPYAYDKGPKTIPGSGIDPQIPDTEIEWFTERRGVVVLDTGTPKIIIIIIA